MSTAETAQTEKLQQQDNLVVHPWEDFNEIGNQTRTIIEGSDGIYVMDSDGNRLIDGPAGMWCVNIGHGRREMADCIAEQAMQLPYFSPWSIATAPAAVLAEKIASLAPGDLKRVFFATGGSSAVDSALRFVMFYNNRKGRPEKKQIISRQEAYHGSTYLAAACSGKQADKKDMDFADELVHLIPSPNPYKRPAGMSLEDFRAAKLADLENKILEVGPDKVAAFIAEPILASGGVIVPPPGYHKGCLEICRKYDVLYISDEVVTGFGRLGHFFASEAVFDILPDIITTAKGLTSGYVPMGAVLISERLVQELGDSGDDAAIFSNGFTYSGHPVAAAAALKNIEIMEREDLMAHVREVGPYFQERMQSLRQSPIVGDVRGMGLMACVECDIVKDGKTDEKLSANAGSRIDKHCQELGLIVRPIGSRCVMSPPLIITKAQIDELVGILQEGIRRTEADLQAEGLIEA
ncbi:MAG TPA: aminotransferase [Kiloniellaceae bacterium]|nr:aminotransferase [Kiloniellaceae bacterium]